MPISGYLTLSDAVDIMILPRRSRLVFVVSGVKDKGDVLQGDGIKRAYELGSALLRGE